MVRGPLDITAISKVIGLYGDAKRTIVVPLNLDARWAHVRRKFYDLDQAHASSVAKEAIQHIGELYAIENEIRGRLPHERRAARQARERPLLEFMRAWFESQLP